MARYSSVAKPVSAPTVKYTVTYTNIKSYIDVKSLLAMFSPNIVSV